MSEYADDGAKATGGYVIYGRTIKTGDYENKKAEVRLDFSFGDVKDQAGVLHKVAELATHKTHEILFAISAGAASRAAAPPIGDEPAAHADAAPAGARKPRAVKPPSTPKPETITADAAEVVDEPAGEAAPATVAAGAEAAVASDPAAVDESLFGAAEAEITDVELTGAVTRKNQEITNPPAIRALIGSFFRDPAGKQVKDIPQEQRAAFLAKLAELKKA